MQLTRKRFPVFFSFICMVLFFGTAYAAAPTINKAHDFQVFQNGREITVQFKLSKSELNKPGVGPLKELAFVTYTNARGACVAEKHVFPLSEKNDQAIEDSKGIKTHPTLNLVATNNRYIIKFQLKFGAGYLKFFLGYGEKLGSESKRYLAGQTGELFGPQPPCLDRSSNTVPVIASRVETGDSEPILAAKDDRNTLTGGNAPDIQFLSTNFNLKDETVPRVPSPGFNQFVSGSDWPKAWKDLNNPFYFPPVPFPKKNQLQQSIRFKLDRGQLPSDVSLENALDVIHLQISNQKRPEKVLEVSLCKKNAPIPTDVVKRYCLDQKGKYLFYDQVYWPGNRPGTFFIPVNGVVTYASKPEPVNLFIIPDSIDIKGKTMY